MTYQHVRAMRKVACEGFDEVNRSVFATCASDRDCYIAAVIRDEAWQPVFDEGTDVGLELPDGGVNTSLDLLSGELSEPALDLIDP